MKRKKNMPIYRPEEPTGKRKPWCRVHLTILITAIFLVYQPAGQAQSVSLSIRTAFENSYTFETKLDYKKAIKCLTDVYSEGSYEMNLRLGWLNYQSGVYTLSAGYYQKAIRLKPLSIEAKLGFALPASAMGNWTQVIAQYNDILKIDPLNSTANYRMGLICYNRSDYLKAEKYLEKVVNLFPFDYDSNLLYAWTNLKLGKYREAQVLFSKVLLIRPNDKSALEGSALIK